jgi:hypothetical protein
VNPSDAEVAVVGASVPELVTPTGTTKVVGG